MVAVRYQVTWYAQGIELSVGQHHRPLYSAKCSNGSGTVSSGDGAPRLVYGFPQKVIGVESHSKGAAGIENDRYGVVARVVLPCSLGFESGQEGRIEGRYAGLVDFGRESDG